MKKRNLFIVVLAFLTILILLSILFFNLSQKQSTEIESDINRKNNFEIAAENLEIPWEIEFLPNGEMLVTERTGNLIRIGKDKKIIMVEGVKHIGEGGLLGLTLHPDFTRNNFIYIYFTSEINGKIENRVERYTIDLDNNNLSERKIIISGIPGAQFHDGGRIKFGPDGYLYITTGDATIEKLSQDVNSPAGKILRVDDEGRISENNPFGNAVYSYGHRNSQGITWDDSNRLWATEHGRSGVQSGFDELNLIEKGKNYGWPNIQGDETKSGMEKPIIHSGADETWAPAGAIFFERKIFFTGLRGEALYEYDIETGKIEEHFKNEFGRLRAIALHNGFIYFSTSNRDGRGRANKGDDKIIKIEADSL